MKNCKEGQHPLIKIQRRSNGFEDEVVKWCPVCGAIVIDIELGGIVYSSREMKMKLPEITRKEFDNASA